MKFKFLSHTADLKFRAYGKNLNEAFENAGLAFFESITNTKKVEPSNKKEIKISAQDKESLLYDFLEELLILQEADKYLFSKFKVTIKDNTLTASLWGEKINNKHEMRSVVKAITYNEMKIIKEKGKVTLQVVLDI